MVERISDNLGRTTRMFTSVTNEQGAVNVPIATRYAFDLLGHLAKVRSS